MRKTILALCCITMTHFVFGQIPSQEYFDLIWKADSLYKSNDYKASALTYTDAFNVNGGKAYMYDQYNAAGSWALAGESDSAFSNLERFIAELNFSDYDHVINNTDLNSLHNDKRWQPLLTAIKANKDAEEASANKPPNVISNSSVSEESDVTYLYLNTGEGFSKLSMFGIGVNFIFSDKWGISINHNEYNRPARYLPFDYQNELCASDDCMPRDTFMFTSFRLIREFTTPTKLIRIGAEAGFTWDDCTEASFTYDNNNTWPNANYIPEYKIYSTMGLSLRGKIEFPVCRFIGLEIAWLSIIDKFQTYSGAELHLTLGLVRDRIKPKKK